MTLEHQGQTYQAYNVTAESTLLCHDDRGFMPRVETGQGILPGIAFGPHLEYLGLWLARFTETIGASSWEQVAGKSFILLADGGLIKGVANRDASKVMIWREFFEEVRAEAHEVAVNGG